LLVVSLFFSWCSSFCMMTRRECRGFGFFFLGQLRIGRHCLGVCKTMQILSYFLCQVFYLFLFLGLFLFSIGSLCVSSLFFFGLFSLLICIVVFFFVVVVVVLAV